MNKNEILTAGGLTLAQLRHIAVEAVPVALDPACRPGVRAAAALVHQAASGGAAVYGVNTGFGKLANTRIAKDDLATLQLKLLRSHSVGVGEPLSAPVLGGAVAVGVACLLLLELLKAVRAAAAPRAA